MSFWPMLAFVAATAPAPTISSLNYTQGTIDGGGQSIVITGTGFTGTTGASGVTFLGTNATSYTVNSDTQITATLPAHAAGSGNVQVTAPGGSATIAFEYYSPAQESLGLWVRGSYTAPGSNPRWTGLASAGSSSGHNLNQDASADAVPATGTAVGGFTPAHFVANSALAASTTLANTVSAAAGTVIVLALPGTLSAQAGTADQDPTLACSDGNRIINLSLTSSGSRMTVHDSGGDKTTANNTFTGGVYSAFIGQWDSTNVYAQVNGSAVQQTAAGALSATTDSLIFGKTPGIAFGTYDMLEVIAAPSKLSSTVLGKIRKYFNQRYGVST